MPEKGRAEDLGLRAMLRAMLRASAQCAGPSVEPQTRLPIGRQAIAQQSTEKCIYCELELNLRIKPRKRLKRDKPDALAVPEAPNMT
jgi:hypothetical protein